MTRPARLQPVLLAAAVLVVCGLVYGVDPGESATTLAWAAGGGVALSVGGVARVASLPGTGRHRRQQRVQIVVLIALGVACLGVAPVSGWTVEFPGNVEPS